MDRKYTLHNGKSPDLSKWGRYTVEMTLIKTIKKVGGIMESKMKKTNYVGVYQRTLESKYKPKRGKEKPDCSFYAVYKVDAGIDEKGRKIKEKKWEHIGKESEGYTAL